MGVRHGFRRCIGFALQQDVQPEGICPPEHWWGRAEVVAPEKAQTIPSICIEMSLYSLLIFLYSTLIIIYF